MKPLSQHIHESFQDNKEVKETIIENINEEVTIEETSTEETAASKEE
jgi:hypothetical protein